MPQNNYETQTEKYEFISDQHGGYYRHNFIDHAYLYNLYFPPEAIFTNLKDQIHDLVLNYPVAQDALPDLSATSLTSLLKELLWATERLN
jgi:threonine-phosphate decarboxylase